MEFNVQVKNETEAKAIYETILKKTKKYQPIRFNTTPKSGQILIWKKDDASALQFLLDRFNFRKVFLFCAGDDITIKKFSDLLLEESIRHEIYNTKHVNFVVNLHFFTNDLENLIEDSLPSSSIEAKNERYDFWTKFQRY